MIKMPEERSNIVPLHSTKVIAVVNQKGGSGKTTTSGSLAAGAAKLGYRVAVLDIDPQCNLTSDTFNYDPDELAKQALVPIERMLALS